MPLKTLIDREIERIQNLGYKTFVSKEKLRIDKAVKQLALGNDSYVLTGISVSERDKTEDVSRVCIISATDSICGTQQEIDALGTSVYALMRDFIIVKTTGADESGDVSPYTLHFMKISQA